MNEWRGAACSETTQRVSEAEGEGEWSWFFFFLLWGVMGGAPRHSSAQRREQRQATHPQLTHSTSLSSFNSINCWTKRAIDWELKRRVRVRAAKPKPFIPSFLRGEGSGRKEENGMELGRCKRKRNEIKDKAEWFGLDWMEQQQANSGRNEFIHWMEEWRCLLLMEWVNAAEPQRRLSEGCGLGLSFFVIDWLWSMKVEEMDLCESQSPKVPKIDLTLAFVIRFPWAA